MGAWLPVWHCEWVLKIDAVTVAILIGTQGSPWASIEIDYHHIIRLSILIIRTKILRYAALPSFGRLSGLPSIVVGGADSQGQFVDALACTGDEGRGTLR
jgi:hypothetical protein